MEEVPLLRGFLRAVWTLVSAFVDVEFAEVTEGMFDPLPINGCHVRIQGPVIVLAKELPDERSSRSHG